jgi:hypothetical protein
MISSSMVIPSTSGSSECFFTSRLPPRSRAAQSHTALILLIVMISVTVGGIALLYDFQQRAAAVPSAMSQGFIAENEDDLTVVNVIGTDAAGRNLSGVRIQVRYDGEGELDINDTFIQIRMDESTADLRYRDGTLERSIAEGYYTQ